MAEPAGPTRFEGALGVGDAATPERETRYRSVIEALAEGVSVYDREGRLIETNPTASEILGLPTAEYRERALSDPAWWTIHEDGTPWRPEEYPVFRTLRTGVALRRQVMGVRRPDGEWRWISINTQPVFEGDDPRPALTVASFTDITDRKEIEARLRESEDRYRSLVEHAPIGIAVHQQGRFVYANQPLAAMLGAPRPEVLLGREVMEFVHPDFRAVVAGRMREITEHGAGVPTIEERFVGVDGRVIDVEVAGSACVFGGQPGVQVAVLDISERKQLEGQLLQAQKMEAVGLLASGVAHEFGNLLTAITGYTALAKRTLAPSHPAVQALERVEEAAEQAAGMTGSLLTFGRKAAGEKEPIPLMEPVERAARLLRRTLPAAIDLRVGGDPAVWVMADGNQIQQAVVNLAINAADAIRGVDGGRLDIAVEADAAWAWVRVADTGQGMTDAVRSRVFEPFFTTKPPGEGTGLGLSIVRSIVEDHGGTVEISSAPGRGTAVTLRLPRADPPRHGGSAGERAGSVLLAGGGRHARELMAGALMEMGYAVVQAADGPGLRDGRAALGDGAALMVIAADLAGGSGVECLKEMRAKGDRTPAILVRSAPRRGDEPGPESPDAWTAVLSEPFPMGELIAVVSRLLGPPREESRE